MAKSIDINGVSFNAEICATLTLTEFIKAHGKLGVFSKQKDSKMITEAYYIINPTKRPKKAIKEDNKDVEATTDTNTNQS